MMHYFMPKVFAIYFVIFQFCVVRHHSKFFCDCKNFKIHSEKSDIHRMTVWEFWNHRLIVWVLWDEFWNVNNVSREKKLILLIFSYFPFIHISFSGFSSVPPSSCLIACPLYSLPWLWVQTIRFLYFLTPSPEFSPLLIMFSMQYKLFKLRGAQLF